MVTVSDQHYGNKTIVIDVEYINELRMIHEELVGIRCVKWLVG